MLRRNATVKPFLVSLVEPVAYLKSELIFQDTKSRVTRPIRTKRNDYRAGLLHCGI